MSDANPAAASIVSFVTDGYTYAALTFPGSKTWWTTATRFASVPQKCSDKTMREILARSQDVRIIDRSEMLPVEGLS